jgi:hypothetical protein
MSRTLVNLFLDGLLLLLVVSVLGTTSILKLVFPPATQSVGWTLLGMDYDGWANVHFALLAMIMLCILVHIMLHWNWVCGVIATRLLGRKGKVDDGWQTLYGVGTLIVVLAVLGTLLVAAQLIVQGPGLP